MRSLFARAAAALAVAATATGTVTSAHAQLQRLEDTTVTTGFVPDPTAGAPSGTPFASATHRAVTYEPVCYVFRQQFADEYGWRVRTVRVCY